MFIAALLLIAQTWKQLTCLSVAACVNKLVPTDNGVSCGALKKELSRHEKIWIKPKQLLLDEMN